MTNLAPFVELPYTKPNGQVVKGLAVNPVKDHVRGFHLVSIPLTVTLPAIGSAEELIFLIDSSGHFDWVYLVGTSGGNNYFLDFFDPGRQRKLQNKPVPSENVVGTGQRPFRLPEPYLFNVGDAERRLIVRVTNLFSVGGVTLRLALYGRRFYHHEAQPDAARYISNQLGEGERAYDYLLVPKEYGNDGTPVTVAALGTSTFTFRADSDADTDIHKMMVSAQGAFTFTLRELATNRVLSNGPILGTLGLGTAQFPFYFADTLLLERDKELVMTVTDLSNENNRIAVTLAGRVLRYER
jgi:hypothetical protein